MSDKKKHKHQWVSHYGSIAFWTCNCGAWTMSSKRVHKDMKK